MAKTVTIIEGPIGSGKSTIAKALMALYEESDKPVIIEADTTLRDALEKMKDSEAVILVGDAAELSGASYLQDATLYIVNTDRPGLGTTKS